MVRSEQGLAGDTRDLSSIPVLAKCTGILAPHPVVPVSIGMTLATPLYLPLASGSGKLWLWPPVWQHIPFVPNATISSLCTASGQGPGTGSTQQDVSGVTEGMEGMLLLSFPVLPVLGAWAGHGQR